MKVIGILGGLGPEATRDYYREIIEKFKEMNHNGNLIYPEIVIYSVNMSRFICYLENEIFDKAVEYISGCINKLEKAGADFAAISANTPHLLFNEIQEKVNLPLISIVETCKLKASEHKLKRCGLLGTKFTMNAGFYKDSFKTSGIEVISPDPKEIEFINNKLFSELEIGIFNDETRDQILQIVQGMIGHHKIDSLILGCTEFPLMFDKEEYLGIPFLNTTKIHVERIVNECLEIKY